MSRAPNVVIDTEFDTERRAFDRLPDATFVLDQRGRILDLNIAAERALSRPRAQLLGSTVRELGASPALLCRFDGALRQVVREGKAHETVVQFDTPLGPRHWEVRLCPDAGDAAGPSVLAVGRDVTARTRREEELIARSKELSQFGDSLCHDLRSPLATIRCFLGFLAADLQAHDDAQIAADIGSIHSTVDRMTDLITTIVKRTRLNGSVVTPSESSLRDVIGDALSLVAGDVAARGAVLEITDEPWLISGERGSLVEIFENLLENAAKFSKPGERPHIEISVEEWGGSPTICVCDRGIGIDPAKIHRVFERFERLDADHEGTGVGLSLVKRLVERHGGKVWIESPGVGHGTTVRLTLAGMSMRSGAAAE
ncbi:MAG TPA: PAS domain-containing sensor histidine kinase [Polyangiaceae bacterium]|jgi:PAS domain S-box-containing protein|nr:PAS domain-containing sensor histidine kinase [Polyangiaceae bacterium]